uniref:Uncharacterized protein n=1 Tax=Acrobeloides nanus TaxID=290746 RepID=A0A914CYW4_9BILA
MSNEGVVVSSTTAQQEDHVSNPNTPNEKHDALDRMTMAADTARAKTHLNPLDYVVWSILEEKACQKPHPKVESLKKALKKAWKEITLDTLVKIVDNFPKRLKAYIDARGSHFE